MGALPDPARRLARAAVIEDETLRAIPVDVTIEPGDRVRPEALDLVLGMATQGVRRAAVGDLAAEPLLELLRGEGVAPGTAAAPAPDRPTPGMSQANL